MSFFELIARIQCKGPELGSLHASFSFQAEVLVTWAARTLNARKRRVNEIQELCLTT